MLQISANHVFVLLLYIIISTLLYTDTTCSFFIIKKSNPYNF
jgi:hypothetical protein